MKASQTLLVRDSEGTIYMLTQEEEDTASSLGDFTCPAGPVICIAFGVYEHWISTNQGPQKKILRSFSPKERTV